MGWKNYRTGLSFYLLECKKHNNKPKAKTEQEYYDYALKNFQRVFDQHRRNGISEREILNMSVGAYAGVKIDLDWAKQGRPSFYLTKEALGLIEGAKFDDAGISEAIVGRWPFDFTCLSVITTDCNKYTSTLIGLFSEANATKIVAIGNDNGQGRAMLLSSYDQDSIFKMLIDEDVIKSEMLMQTANEQIRNGFRLALRLGVYLQAFPDSIRPGFPDGMSNYEQKQQNTANAFRIGLPAKYHNSPVSHWRSGHFRRLLDEKFKRDDEGRARIIYVNPCLVGEKVDPYTVEAARN